jgi:hypothetical protein
MLGLGFGCASTPSSQPPSDDKKVTLVQAKTQILEEQLLDVMIPVFEPGLPEEGEELPPGVFPELRKSESMYFAVQLADTLQSTGHWGAVRVAPDRPTSSDLTVLGTIIKSTGKTLVLAVEAVDSTGRVWLDRKYKETANPLAYGETPVKVNDPFQAIYIRIANDLLAVRQEKSLQQIAEVRSVTRIRYAADLLPSVYADYLERDRKGRIDIARLPAQDDPMMQRVAKVYEREAMFVDVLNQHYTVFFDEMDEPYDDWRQFAYQEEIALDAMRKKARTQKILGAIAVLGAVLAEPSSGAEAAVRDVAVLGGMAAIQAGFATSKEAKIHIEALQELGASFESEVEPLVIEVEGQTIRLTGSVQEQYETWRQLLRQIYAAETGFPVDPNSADQPPDSSVPEAS